jgi:hypothetical protein
MNKELISFIINLIIFSLACFCFYKIYTSDSINYQLEEVARRSRRGRRGRRGRRAASVDIDDDSDDEKNKYIYGKKVSCLLKSKFIGGNDVYLYEEGSFIPCMY